MSLKSKFINGLFWSSIEHFGNKIIAFGISVILARLLVPEDFGLIAILSVFIGLGNVLINSGLTQSLVRTSNPKNIDFSTVFYFNLIGSIVVYLLIFLIAPYISEFYEQSRLTDIIRVYCLIFLINALSIIQTTRLTKAIDFKTQMIISTPSIIVSGLVGVCLAKFGFGVWSLVWSRIAQALAMTIQLWIRSDWKPLWAFSVTKFKEHFRFGFKLMLSGILNNIFNHIYPIIIGKYFLISQAGYFIKADNLKNLPVNLTNSVVNKVTYPLLAEIQNDEIRMKSIYRRIMKVVVFLVAPSLIFLGVLAEPLFRFLFTEKWLPAVPYFQVLCISGLLYPVHSNNLQILNVKGRSDLVLKLQIFKNAILSLIIIIALNYGIYGLLIGNVAFSIIALLINSHYTGKLIGYNTLHQIKDIFPSIFLAGITGAIIYFLDLHFAKIEVIDFLRIFLGGLIGFLIFIFFSWIFQFSILGELRTIISGRTSEQNN